MLNSPQLVRRRIFEKAPRSERRKYGKTDRRIRVLAEVAEVQSGKKYYLALTPKSQQRETRIGPSTPTLPVLCGLFVSLIIYRYNYHPIKMSQLNALMPVSFV